MIEDKKLHLHDLALRVIKAQNYNELERTNENKQIQKDAATIGFSPNEILTYAMTHQTALENEILVDAIRNSKSFRVAEMNTLSAFTKSYEEITGKKALGPEFFEALNTHVKSVKNFDYYS